MRNKAFLLTALFLLLLLSVNASAGREWYFQRVEDSSGIPLAGGNTAIGMRSGHTWPVVVTDEGSAAMIPGGWANTGSGMGFGGYIDGATSHDGQSMIFANAEGHVQTFGPSGWNQTFFPSNTFGPASRNSVAYTQQNNAAVLYQSLNTNEVTLSVQNNDGWSSESLNGPADAFALSYDSYDQANVVLSDGGMLVYGTKGALTNNQWHFSNTSSDPEPLLVGDVLDLELTANDVPYVAYRDGENLNYATYNIIQSQWESGIIDILGPADNFCMASDQQGGMGVAYLTEIEGLTRLGFAYNDGSGNWVTDLLPDEVLDEFGSHIAPVDVALDFSIGLAFDKDNYPVISYSNHGETWIAYDPMKIPEAPEPATCLLLLFGGTAVLRSRKK